MTIPENNNHNHDIDPAPKSFFFHSPPDSPVQQQQASTNPFLHLKDALVSKLTSKSRPGSSLSPRKSKSPRPSTSDGTPTRKSEHWYLGSTPNFRRSRSSRDGDPSASSDHIQSVEDTDSTSHQANEPQRNSHLFPDDIHTRGTKQSDPSPSSPPLDVQVEDSFDDAEVIDISAPFQKTLQGSVDDSEKSRDIPRSNGLHSTRPFPSGHQNPTVSPIEEERSEEDTSTPVRLVPSRAQHTSQHLSSFSSHSTAPALSISSLPVTDQNLIPQIPPFPAPYISISPSMIRAASLVRYEDQGLGLSHFLAKSRAWKPRLICLTSYISASNGQSTRGYLHVYRHTTPSEDNVEIHRLEITQESVAFVTDEEVGGRQNTVVIGGPDASSSSFRRQRGHVQFRGVNPSHQLCFLDIDDQREKQNWIGAVKSLVLSRRAEVAGKGLLPSPGSSAHGPGDLDLALKLQDLNINQALPPISPVSPMTLSTLDSSTQTVPSATQSEVSLEPSKRLSAVSTLRGFFSSTSLARDPEETPTKPSSKLLRRRSKPPSATESSSFPRATSLRSIFRTSILAPSSRLSIANADTVRRSSNFSPDLQTSDPTPKRTPIPKAPHIRTSTEHPTLNPDRLKVEVNCAKEDAISGLPMAVTRTPKVDHSPQTPEEHRAEALLTLSTPRQRSHPETLELNSEYHRASGPASGPSRPKTNQLSDRNNRFRSSAMIGTSPLPPPTGPLPSPPLEGRRSSSDTGYDIRSTSSRRVSNSSGVTTVPSVSDHQRNSRLSAQSTFSRSSMPPPRRPPPNFAPPPIPHEQFLHDPGGHKPRRAVLSDTNAPVPQFYLPPSTSPPTGPLPPTPTTDGLSPEASAHERPRLHSAPSYSVSTDWPKHDQPDQSYHTSNIVPWHPFSQPPRETLSNNESGMVVAQVPRRFSRRPLPPLPVSQ